MTQMLRDVVQIQGGFKPSVRLPDDFFDEDNNRHFIESYIPTQETLDIFMRIKDSLQPHSEQRAKLFTGTFGTGKSDLMLMIANYITRSSDAPILRPFFERLHNLNYSKAEVIYDARLGKPPFLLVLLQADTVTTFSSFVLRGLEEALTQVGQQDVLGTTYYRAALEQITEWEDTLPDNIIRLKRVLQDTHGMTLVQLKSRLDSPHADSALRIFREVTHTAIGLPFQPADVIERPSNAFEAVAKKLVERRKFSGIFVIADEFTHLLQNLGESSTSASDIKAIDNLAESAVRSGNNQLHFYVVSLEGFSSAQANTHTSQVALERTGGRFIQDELRSQYMEELISASIAKKHLPEKLFADIITQQDELLTLAMRLWGNRSTGRHDREWLRENIVYGCFPLHPLATYCLPLLNRALAQNERTMFSFLWDEQYGLKAFIEETELASTDGRLNLLSLDGLFNYFEINLREKRSELDLFYQQSKSKLSPQQVNDGLEGRLLRTLVLLDVISGDTNLRTDFDTLSQALGLPPSQELEIKAALKTLEDVGITYPTQAGYYQLVKQGQANPRELRNVIERYAQNFIESPIETLNTNYHLSGRRAMEYNSKRGTDRELSASFVAVSQLLNTTTLDQALQNHDALLWYVVADTEEGRLQARSAAMRLTKQYNQLVVAVPFAPTSLVDCLKRKWAVEQLRYNSDYNRADYQELLSNNGVIGRDYLETFERERQKFDDSSQFEWYYEGKTTSVQTTAQLESLATKVMNIVFPLTPAHATAQHLTRSTRNTSKIRDALDKILNPPIKMSNGKSPADTILKNGAGELGLIFYKDREGAYSIYGVCLPDVREPRLRNSKAVWDVLDKRLSDTSISSWSDTVASLKSPPYGLSDSVLQLFLAAFLSLNRDYITIHSIKNAQEPPVEVSGEKIIKIVESPREYVILYKPLASQQVEFLRGLVNILLPSMGSRRSEVVSLLDQVAILLIQKIKGILIISQQPSTNDLVSVLSDNSQEMVATCERLIEVGHLSRELLKIALLDILPSSVGLSHDSTSWTEEMLTSALSQIDNAYKQLQKISSRLRRSIMQQIGQLFGLAEPSKSEKDVLDAAKKWRIEKVKRVRIDDLKESSDAQELLRFLDDDPHSFEQVFLNTLPSRWKLQDFEQWQALSTKTIYLDRLTRAKLFIENKAESLIPKLSEETIEIQPLIRASASSANHQFLSTQPAVAEPRPSSPGDGSSNSRTTEDTAIEEARQEDSKNVISLNGDEQKQVKMASVLDTGTPTQGEKTLVAEQPTGLLSSQTVAGETAVQAFETIKAIFEMLVPSEQIKLWDMLVQEYDPR